MGRVGYVVIGEGGVGWVVITVVGLGGVGCD